MFCNFFFALSWSPVLEEGGGHVLQTLTHAVAWKSLCGETLKPLADGHVWTNLWSNPQPLSTLQTTANKGERLSQNHPAITASQFPYLWSWEVRSIRGFMLSLGCYIAQSQKKIWLTYSKLVAITEFCSFMDSADHTDEDGLGSALWSFYLQLGFLASGGETQVSRWLYFWMSPGCELWQGDKGNQS
jgi:hypothetical protein